MDEFVKKEEKTYIIEADNQSNVDDETDDSTIDDIIEEENTVHEPPKTIEVVTGVGNGLDISSVSDYLEVQKPKEENIKGPIIVPEEKK